MLEKMFGNLAQRRTHHALAQMRRDEDLAALCEARVQRLDRVFGLIDETEKHGVALDTDAATLSVMRTQALVFIGYFKDLASGRVTATRDVVDRTIGGIDEFCQLIEQGLARAGQGNKGAI
jgi:hypothetical protein